jgi:hypothetical protein
VVEEVRVPGENHPCPDCDKIEKLLIMSTRSLKGANKF